MTNDGERMNVERQQNMYDRRHILFLIASKVWGKNNIPCALCMQMLVAPTPPSFE